MKKLIRSGIRRPTIILAILDFSLMFSVLGFLASTRYSSFSEFLFFSTPYIYQSFAYASVGCILLFTLGAYRPATLSNGKLLAIVIMTSHLFTLVILTILFYLFPIFRIWISALIPSLVVTSLGVLLIHFLFSKFVDIKMFHRRLLVIGTGQVAAHLQKYLQSKNAYMNNCVGFLSVEGEDRRVPAAEILQTKGSLADFVQVKNVDEIVVALDECRNRLPIQDLLECRIKGIKVSNVSSFFEREEGRVDYRGLYPSWMIFSAGFNAPTPSQRIIKRLFDIVVSTALFLFTLPIMILTIVLILVQDGGPVFYVQQRVGLNGRPFNLLKFRSMRMDAEQDGVARWASPNDDRVTTIGRFIRRTRIDELPQLINVLCGQMSFVGPRPERPEFVSVLQEIIPNYGFRHYVKPGITGWAQIQYPYAATVDDAKEKLSYDLYYIKNYGWYLDMLVILQTIRVIIWPDFDNMKPELSQPPSLETQETQREKTRTDHLESTF